MDTEPLKLRLVLAECDVTPLREGGFMPAIVETDGLGSYVLKLRGAGQGRARARVLVSRLPIAEIVLAHLSGDLSRTESQPEIPDLIRTSDGSIAQFPMRARHHWLTAKRCSISQTSSSHMGLCMQPGEGLERIMQRMVLPIS